MLWFLGIVLAAEAPVEPKTLSLTAGGDVMFGRYSQGSYREVGGSDPFAYLTSELSGSDLTFVNLESPLMEGHPQRYPAAPRGLVFRGEAYRAKQLADAGIDVVTLANNHAEDLRMPGIETSLAILEEAGIASFGAVTEGDPFAPARLESQGTEVLFFGATTRRNIGEPRRDQWIPSAYRHWRYLENELPERIRSARASHPDALILVSMHWGEEYVTHAPKEHQNLSRAVIDAGANGVLGHHPHVLQPVEVYNGALILYSMGNLVFDQRASYTKRSALFTMEWKHLGAEGWKLSELEVIPVLLPGGHDGPNLAPPDQAAIIVEAVKKGAQAQGTVLVEKEGRLFWSAEGEVEAD